MLLNILNNGLIILALKDSNQKSFMIKDFPLWYSPKLKETYPWQFSFMAISINNLHSKDGTKDLEPLSLLSKTINFMVEEELMMDIPPMEPCLLSKLFNNKKLKFHVLLSNKLRMCNDYRGRWRKWKCSHATLPSKT